MKKYLSVLLLAFAPVDLYAQVPNNTQEFLQLYQQDLDYFNNVIYPVAKNIHGPFGIYMDEATVIHNNYMPEAIKLNELYGRQRGIVQTYLAMQINDRQAANDFNTFAQKLAGDSQERVNTALEKETSILKELPDSERKYVREAQKIGDIFMVAEFKRRNDALQQYIDSHHIPNSIFTAQAASNGQSSSVTVPINTHKFQSADEANAEFDKLCDQAIQMSPEVQTRFKPYMAQVTMKFMEEIEQSHKEAGEKLKAGMDSKRYKEFLDNAYLAESEERIAAAQKFIDENK